MVCDVEIKQYIIYVLLYVLPYISFLLNYYLYVSLQREKEREKMKEGRGLEDGTMTLTLKERDNILG